MPRYYYHYSVVDRIIVTRHLSAGSVTQDIISDGDWSKYVQAYCYSAISGTYSLRVSNEIGVGNPSFFSVEMIAKGSLTYKIVLQAGTYHIGMMADRDVNRGTVSLSVDGTAVGVGVDFYASSRSNAFYGVFTNSFTITKSKLVTVVFSSDTPSNASTGRYVFCPTGMVFRKIS